MAAESNPLSSYFPLDIASVTASYLTPSPSSSLEERVKSLVRIHEFCLVVNEPFEETLANAEIHLKTKGKQPLDDQVISLILDASQGNLAAIDQKLRSNIFNFPSDRLIYNSPCYIAIREMIKMACKENQIDVLQYLLNHPKFKKMATVKQMNFQDFYRGHEKIRDRDKARKFSEQYSYEEAIRIGIDVIFKEAAIICCQSNRPECLSFLFSEDFKRCDQQNRKGSLQFATYDLHLASDGNEAIRKILLENFDSGD